MRTSLAPGPALVVCREQQSPVCRRMVRIRLGKERAARPEPPIYIIRNSCAIFFISLKEFLKGKIGGEKCGKEGKAPEEMEKTMLQ